MTRRKTICIDRLISENIKLITKEIFKDGNGVVIRISTMPLKKKLKQILGKRAFRLRTDEILVKMNSLRNKIYNDAYYKLKRAKNRVKTHNENLLTLINVSKKKARIALGSFILNKSWELVGVLGLTEKTRTQIGSYMAGYHLKRFLVGKNLIKDIFFDIEHTSRYHLNLLINRNPKISEYTLIEVIKNYWHKYHGQCWMEKVDPERDIIYFLKDTYSTLSKLNENGFDLDYDLCNNLTASGLKPNERFLSRVTRNEVVPLYEPRKMYTNQLILNPVIIIIFFLLLLLIFI